MSTQVEQKLNARQVTQLGAGIEMPHGQEATSLAKRYKRGSSRIRSVKLQLGSLLSIPPTVFVLGLRLYAMSWRPLCSLVCRMLVAMRRTTFGSKSTILITATFWINSVPYPNVGHCFSKSCPAKLTKTARHHPNFLTNDPNWRIDHCSLRRSSTYHETKMGDGNADRQ